MSEKKTHSFRIGVSEFLFIIFFLFSGMMLAFSSKSFVLNFKQIGFNICSAFENGVHHVISFADTNINAVKQIATLREEYETLTEKLKDYEYMQRSNAEIRKENERLKALLNYSVSLKQKNIPARIISFDIENMYSAITIDRGSVHGIKKNMSVIAIQNGNPGIVGKVVMVGHYTSQIMPVYDLKCFVSARIQNTRDIGLVSGNGSFSSPLRLKYIRKRVLEDLNFGDVVVTSGENDNYIPDIPIGVISKITVVDYDSSLNIDLIPAVDFMRLEEVLVINQAETNDREVEE